MSHLIYNDSDKLENWKSLKKVAFHVLQPTLFEAIENWSIENITEAVYEQYYGTKYPQIQKIMSKVNINLAEDKLLETTKIEAASDIWVFGYGSLIWKVDFPYICRKGGYIKGYERKFYEKDFDHRGVKEKPGRVVNLVPSSHPNSKVWGIGYRISCKVKNSVVQDLDMREMNGYNRFPVLFYEYPPPSEDCEPIEMLAYVASDDNSSFAGWHQDDIAEQLVDISGASDVYREYVYKLANAIRMLFPNQRDDHLFNLEAKLRMKERKYVDFVDQVKQNIKQVLRTGVLVGRPVGDIRLELKNLDPNN